ncbi:MAG: molybdenum cofactor biosynthesis protein, partial [Bacteroidetes bacterium]|nr:molybdenum cofactor biosynthesis protein [Bacteroidota bacterium]
MDRLTHFDSTGKAVMVDIGSKEIQQRSAKASGHIRLSEETLKLVEENLMKKGDVLTVAQIAGINAAK